MAADMKDNAWAELQMMTPEERQKTLAPKLQNENIDNRLAFLERQLRQANALRSQAGSPNAITPLGAVFGGVGDGIDKFTAARQQKQLADMMQGYLTQRESPSHYTDEYIRFRRGGGGDLEQQKRMAEALRGASVDDTSGYGV